MLRYVYIAYLVLMNSVQNNRYGQLRSIGIYYNNASSDRRESITLPKLAHRISSRFIHFA